jgi:hypothetical protein
MARMPRAAFKVIPFHPPWTIGAPAVWCDPAAAASRRPS